MYSTGNDIVALKAINIVRTKQQNFYKKILSVSEIKLYDQQFSGKIPLENFVWLLWSVKESAYKYLQRIIPELVFSPTRTIVSMLEFPLGSTPTKLEGSDLDKEMAYKGLVSFEDHTLYSRSIVNDGFVFSVVNHEDNFKDTHWGIQLISSSEAEEQSKAVRTFLSARLNILFPDEDLQISKNPHGVPMLLKDGAEIPLPVSLAHHDRYIAYSLQENTD